ncbi:MAG: [protein-PII] uridylyltransferase [Sphingomonadales bacterium]|nr:[protein-PII] uridylyltransferase [Sphingomonadales bacterium]
MPGRFAHIPDQRALIDRRTIGDALAAIGAGEASPLDRRNAAVARLKDALADANAELARRLIDRPSHGLEIAAGHAFVTDQIIRLLHDFVTRHLYPGGNRSNGERLAIVAVGGYGRGEMAPHSDVDLAFVTPGRRTPWAEQVIEAMLYALWDLGLKVGQSSRSIDETVRLAHDDLTIRTALLEARFVWGDREVYDEAAERFIAEILSLPPREFVADKLAERDERHRKMGDSRYVVEPNVKEGKGGLRDLHTLFWIGKYVYRVRTVADLVDAGLLTKRELAQFQRAENWLWSVRCHLHAITGRAEDRLTFDLQREVAARMHYADRPGQSPVERFMQFYFLNAKTVGDLTGVFLAHLDEAKGEKGRRFLPTIRRRPGRLNGFVLDRGRLALPGEDFFRDDPVRMIEIFALADTYGLEIHPLAMRAARRDAKLIERDVRRDRRANALFLDVLTSPRDPATVLRWMNEATVFGRFIPDFGRVVAQMQFDMYHHFTVDEHTIRAIGLLARIESGELKADHPLSHALFDQISNRRALYVAVLLHDIAKGRGGDHSELGAEIAVELCPRLGLSDGETELVAWLVRYHLLMSATAFKRDLADPKTIQDFVASVKSLERLRLLLMLTVVDIRAVGPGVWNDWKRQLIRSLFEAAEEVLRLGHVQHGREALLAQKTQALRAELGWPEDRFAAFIDRAPESFLIAESPEILAHNARHLAAMGDAPLAIDSIVDADRGASLVMVAAADHPGLFYRIAAGIHLVGGNIIDARIHTMDDGIAIDNFLVQDSRGKPFADKRQVTRMKRAIADALGGAQPIDTRLEDKPLPLTRAEAFRIVPSVIANNRASNRFTVIEVNARDRPALLSNLGEALFEAKATLHSAHVATYGERAVDTFYVTDLTGQKIVSQARLEALEKRLLDAARGPLDHADDTDDRRTV